MIENFIFRPDITSGLQSKVEFMRLQSSQANQLKNGKEMADLVHIRPINERNLFGSKQVTQKIGSEPSQHYYKMTRTEKLAQRAEELKNPYQVEAPVQPAMQKPPSERSTHSKVCEPPIAGKSFKDPRVEKPAATYSQDMRHFFGVSSKDYVKQGPSSKRSEVSSKGSYKQDAGAFFGDHSGPMYGNIKLIVMKKNLEEQNQNHMERNLQ